MNWAQTFFIMMAIYQVHGMKREVNISLGLGVIAAALQGVL